MGETRTVGEVGQALAAKLRAMVEASGGTWPEAASVTTSTSGLAGDECPLCQELGYVYLDVAMDDPRFGKLLPCPACERGLAQRRAATEARTGRYCVQLPEKRFDDFQPRGGVVDKALAAARRWADSPARCMVLWGPPGTGKTHLAAAVANRIRERGQDVGFFTAPDLLDMLRSGYDRGDYDTLLDALKNIAVLVLDDLGAEKGTAWAEEKLFQVINHRYNKRLPLLVAMNPNPATLEERIADRLCDVDWSLAVNVDVESWRRRTIATDKKNGRGGRA